MININPKNIKNKIIGTLKRCQKNEEKPFDLPSTHFSADSGYPKIRFWVPTRKSDFGYVPPLDWSVR